jgi:hypothetical protein
MFTTLAFSVALMQAPFRMNAKPGGAAGWREYGARTSGFLTATVFMMVITYIAGPWIGAGLWIRLLVSVATLGGIGGVFALYIKKYYKRMWPTEGEPDPADKKIRLWSEYYRSLMLWLPMLLFFLVVPLPGNILPTSGPMITALSYDKLFTLVSIFVGSMIVPGAASIAAIKFWNRVISIARAPLESQYQRRILNGTLNLKSQARVSALLWRAGIYLSQEAIVYGRWTILEIAWHLWRGRVPGRTVENNNVEGSSPPSRSGGVPPTPEFGAALRTMEPALQINTWRDYVAQVMAPVTAVYRRVQIFLSPAKTGQSSAPLPQDGLDVFMDVSDRASQIVSNGIVGISLAIYSSLGRTLAEKDQATSTAQTPSHRRLIAAA